MTMAFWQIEIIADVGISMNTVTDSVHVHVHVRLCTYAADSSYELSDALLLGCDVGG
jgi:hypothetical protein